MYGPPQSCKRKTEKDKLVCANVFGLWWSQRPLASLGWVYQGLPQCSLAHAIQYADMRLQGELEGCLRPQILVFPEVAQCVPLA